LLHAPRLHVALGAAIAVAAATAATGCGGSSGRQSADRPPLPIVVSASINKDRVTASPARFGAGPIRLVVVNQTDRSQQVTLETADEPGSDKPGIRQQTGPINPDDTAALAADIARGSYEVRVAGDDIRPARLAVGAPRPSSQQDLMIP
jgi:hypothetical protein